MRAGPRAWKTGELELYYAPSYRVELYTRNEGQPEIDDHDVAIQGMRSSVQALRGASKRAVHRHIGMRNDEEAVVFYEQVIEREITLARLFVTEAWSFMDGKWQIVRETVEHLGN
ncbi:hypothetical protein [Alicyclobacillus dauci]|uniref:SnoaL-like domain-containing protein n=1 Tax=Alicyclobacillus dauci TaxID=1475485 RepID=A0ABY6Z395_9BACL|nr:hypothetical protein [Alicyclobacillus dauci]WAH37225.1 hypothetical protein NZD86_01360 [Alicyclobacillus dauci]